MEQAWFCTDVSVSTTEATKGFVETVLEAEPTAMRDHQPPNRLLSHDYDAERIAEKTKEVLSVEFLSLQRRSFREGKSGCLPGTCIPQKLEALPSRHIPKYNFP
jgi:hypothetical protein